MLNLERIFQQDRLLRAMTGLNRKAFEALLPSFAQAYEQSRIHPNIERKRAIGGGRKATLRTPGEKTTCICPQETEGQGINPTTAAGEPRV